MRVVIYLPDNPTVTSQEKGFNRYTGQIYTKSEVKNLKSTYAFEIRRAMSVDRIPNPRFTGAVRLNITFVFRSPVKKSWGKYKLTKPDCDNCAKGLIDVLGDDREVGLGWFENGDQQVCDLRVIKKWGDKPMVIIEAEEISE